MIVQTRQSLEAVKHHNHCSSFVEINSLGTSEMNLSCAADMVEDFPFFFLAACNSEEAPLPDQIYQYAFLNLQQRLPVLSERKAALAPVSPGCITGQ